jgi:acyl-coenzyme A thioesterase PaaI-like protein
MPEGVLPWTKSCFVCGEDNPHGLRLKSRVENGRVVLDYTIREADRGYRSIVHGGITMTLLDEVMTWSAIIASRRLCVAAELTVRLKSPLSVGQSVRVEGVATEAKGRLVLTKADVLDADGCMLASATGKYVPMPPEHAQSWGEDFVSDPSGLSPDALLGEPLG